jgi:hypothetical protein
MIRCSPCAECKHLQPNRPGVPIHCAAFPAGIPDVILDGDFDHRQPYEGDNGVRYEPDEPGGHDYWSEVDRAVLAQ